MTPTTPASPATAASAPTSPKTAIPTIPRGSRRSATTPTVTAYPARITPIPTSRAILSAVPNHEIARSLTGGGTRSMTRSPTSRIGERVLADNPATSSAAPSATPAATRPIVAPRPQSFLEDLGPVSEDSEKDVMPPVRHRRHDGLVMAAVKRPEAVAEARRRCGPDRCEVRCPRRSCRRAVRCVRPTPGARTATPWNRCGRRVASRCRRRVR